VRSRAPSKLVNLVVRLCLDESNPSVEMRSEWLTCIHLAQSLVGARSPEINWFLWNAELRETANNQNILTQPAWDVCRGLHNQFIPVLVSCFGNEDTWKAKGTTHPAGYLKLWIRLGFCLARTTLKRFKCKLPLWLPKQIKDHCLTFCQRPTLRDVNLRENKCAINLPVTSEVIIEHRACFLHLRSLRSHPVMR